MKIRLLISALSIAVLIVGPVTHAAIHEVIPDEQHEFVECYGCSAGAVAVEARDTYCHLRRCAAKSFLTTDVVRLTGFNNYSSRAPPNK